MNCMTTSRVAVEKKWANERTRPIWQQRKGGYWAALIKNRSWKTRRCGSTGERSSSCPALPCPALPLPLPCPVLSYPALCNDITFTMTVWQWMKQQEQQLLMPRWVREWLAVVVVVVVVENEGGLVWPFRAV